MKSKEEKPSIVKRVLSGEAVQKIEREEGIDHHVIQRWIAKSFSYGEGKISGRREEPLKKGKKEKMKDGSGKKECCAGIPRAAGQGIQ